MWVWVFVVYWMASMIFAILTGYPKNTSERPMRTEFMLGAFAFGWIPMGWGFLMWIVLEEWDWWNGR
jgi:hypothetical protein